MKILVIGSGGREHALVWKISQSKKVDKIYCAPGNGGIRSIAECISIEVDEVERLLEFAFENRIDLTVVGPEAPLTLGIVDRFRAAGLKIFGPGASGAILEGSKAYSKDFMLRHGIPTAKYKIYNDPSLARAEIEQFGFPVVIKADGLAAGKGVIIAKDMTEALEAIHYVMEEKKFGDAGVRIVLEEFLVGQEASILAFLDGNVAVPMVSAQDYKRAYDGDLGPNTGGMGAISPARHYSIEMQRLAEKEIIDRTVEALKAENIDYHGVLYFGLMLTESGPKVIEYNARFGDPETEAVLMRLESDIVEIFFACIEGRLSDYSMKWSEKAAMCVVVAAEGYPGEYRKGAEITGHENMGESGIVFHGGTIEKNGEILTNGGRVLIVSSLGENIDAARTHVYQRIKKIRFTGMQFRKDIGN